MRIWFKQWKDRHMLRDCVVCDDGEDTRTHKVFRALEQACYEFDLKITEGGLYEKQKTRFGSDNFMDAIAFDYLEMHVIEE